MTGKIIHGDCLEVMAGMDASSVDLIYLDPPYNSGREYVGKAGRFDDRFKSAEAYVEFMEARFVEMKRILKDSGCIWCQCDDSAVHHLRVLMEKVWGAGWFRGQIVWKRSTGSNVADRKFPRVVDYLLHFGGKGYTHNPQYGPLDQEYIDKFYTHSDEGGRFLEETQAQTANGGDRTLYREHCPHTTGDDRTLHQPTSLANQTGEDRSRYNPDIPMHGPGGDDRSRHRLSDIEGADGATDRTRYREDSFHNPDGPPRGIPDEDLPNIDCADDWDDSMKIPGLKGYHFKWRGYSPPDKGWRGPPRTMQKMHDEGRLIYPTKPDGTPDYTKRIREKRYLKDSRGKPVMNLWDDIPGLTFNSLENTGWPTQKPLELLDRVIETSSNPGDLVFDPFCGSGTTAMSAKRLGRRWLTCDRESDAVEIARDRVEGIMI